MVKITLHQETNNHLYGNIKSNLRFGLGNMVMNIDHKVAVV